MNYIVLNKFSKVPLYLQLKDSLKKAINDGVLKNKDQLPTEESICQIFNVSRPVVRQAYNELIEEGLIQRHQGKGTYVNKKIVFTNLMHRMNYDEEILKRGMIPETRIFMVDVIDRSQLPNAANFLDHLQSFFLLKRIRKADHVPLFYDEGFFPTDVFPNLKDDVNHLNSYNQYLRDHIQFDEIRQETYMTVTALEEEAASILEVKPLTAAFEFISAGRDMEGHLIYFRRAYFPGERHTIQIEMEQKNGLY